MAHTHRIHSTLDYLVDGIRTARNRRKHDNHHHWSFFSRFRWYCLVAIPDKHIRLGRFLLFPLSRGIWRRHLSSRIVICCRGRHEFVPVFLAHPPGLCGRGPRKLNHARNVRFLAVILVVVLVVLCSGSSRFGPLVHGICHGLSKKGAIGWGTLFQTVSIDWFLLLLLIVLCPVARRGRLKA